VLVSLWDDAAPADALIHDWLAQPRQALQAARRRAGGASPRDLVLLDRGDCAGGFAAGLRGTGVRRLVYFADGGWQVMRVGGWLPGSRPAPAPGVPLVFDRTEQLPVRYTWGAALVDLRTDLQWSLAPRRAAARSEVSVFDQRRGLLRPDTPRRALRLVDEGAGWAVSRLREQRLLRTLADALAVPGSGGPAVADGGGRVVLVVTELSAGGAERQLCNLALGLLERGCAVRVMTLHALSGSNAHYLGRLQGAGIEVLEALAPLDQVADQAGVGAVREAPLEQIAALPVYVRRYVWPLYTHLQARPVDAVLTFLDLPNLAAGLASLLAGVPRVILSFRNHNPTHFGFHQGWFRRYYRLLLTSPRVVLTGNSVAGNRSYATWLGIDPGRIRLLRNGVDIPRLPGPAAGAGLRQRLGIGAGCPLVVGVFRLAPEKRPDLFVRVFHRLCAEVDGVTGLVLGDGPLRGAVADRVRGLGLEARLRLLGRQADVLPYLEAADVVLQTAALEGTPNSLLEAQFLGTPVVTTRAGGAAEAVDDGGSGYVVDGDDPERLAWRTAELLLDRTKARAMGERGRQFVAARFSPERLTEQAAELIGIR
jgi:glycosyltransferase involved in cell wall biosynthesis